MKKPALIFFGRPLFRQSLYDYIPELKAISGYKEETSFSRYALKETHSLTVVVGGYNKQGRVDILIITFNLGGHNKIGALNFIGNHLFGGAINFLGCNFLH